LPRPAMSEYSWFEVWEDRDGLVSTGKKGGRLKTPRGTPSSTSGRSQSARGQSRSHVVPAEDEADHRARLRVEKQQKKQVAAAYRKELDEQVRAKKEQKYQQMRDTAYTPEQTSFEPSTHTWGQCRTLPKCTLAAEYYRQELTDQVQAKMLAQSEERGQEKAYGQRLNKIAASSLQAEGYRRALAAAEAESALLRSWAGATKFKEKRDRREKDRFAAHPQSTTIPFSLDRPAEPIFSSRGSFRRNFQEILKVVNETATPDAMPAGEAGGCLTDPPMRRHGKRCLGRVAEADAAQRVSAKVGPGGRRFRRPATAKDVRHRSHEICSPSFAWGQPI